MSSSRSVWTYRGNMLLYGEMCEGILENPIHVSTHLSVTIPMRTFVGPALSTGQCAGRQKPAGDVGVYYIQTEKGTIPWVPSEGRPLGGMGFLCQEEAGRWHGYTNGLNFRALRQHFDHFGRAEVVAKSLTGEFASSVYVVVGCFLVFFSSCFPAFRSPLLIFPYATSLML